MIWNTGLQNMSAGSKRKFRLFLRHPLFICLMAGILLCGCAGRFEGKEQDTETGKIRVVTTIFPPYDFVREIAGDEVELKMLLKPGQEAHSYEPTPQDIIAIENSDIFIYVGGENDQWVEDILDSMPESDTEILRLTDCVDTLEEEHVEGMKEERGHSHDETGKRQLPDGTQIHSVHQIDEHVWTSPKNAARIVDQIQRLLSGKDSANREFYRENAESYKEKLLELDNEFRRVTENSKRRLVIFGDRFPFRYFTEEYGLSYYAAFPGCASDTEPSASTMAFLIDKVKEEDVPVVLKMELSNDDISRAIAEATGTKVRTFYSCHNISAEDFENGGSYLSMMQKNVDTLREALN